MPQRSAISGTTLYLCMHSSTHNRILRGNTCTEGLVFVGQSCSHPVEGWAPARPILEFLLFMRRPNPLSPKFDTVTHVGRGLAVGVRLATDLARETMSIGLSTF